MAPTDLPDAELADRIDRVCVQFEADWKAGRRPTVEDIVTAWDGPARAELLAQLLAIEFHYRRRAGDGLPLADYLRRFPNDREAIERTEREYGVDALQNTTTHTTDRPGAEGGTANDGSAPAGAVFGYRILGELGGGGQGIVYRALQVGLNREVALKRIRAGAVASVETLSRFWTEAESLGRMRHPNIVQVYDFGREGGEPYLCMELLTGGCLADRLAAGPLPPRDAAELVRTLALAIQAAHDAGVVHRDLKPSNVLFDAAGVPKLADFGLAKLLDAADARPFTEEGAIVGTFAYMAPEQAAGRSVTRQVDVHALGVLLFEALTGERPFGGERASEILAAVVNRDAAPPSAVRLDCPRDLDLVCLRCLRKAPGDRYPSARALAEDLGRWLRGEAVTRPGSLQRLAGWAVRQPMLAATLCSLVVLYAVHLVCVFAGLTDSGGRFHTAATVVVPVWAAGATLCQRLLDHARWARTGAYAWATMQIVLVTALLWAGRGPVSAIVAAFPLLVAGAALSSGVRMAWYTAAIAALGYSAVALGAWLFRPDDRVAPSVALVFVAMLLLLALIQSLLLRRPGRQ